MTHARPIRRGALALAAFAAVGAAGLVALPLPQPATATAIAATVRPAQETQAARTYNVDPVHSSVIFSALYMGMSPFYGQFTDYSGTLTYDGQTPESFDLTFEIPMDSIDTHNEQRDAHLKSPDFFNAREYPTVKFVSKKLTETGDGTYELTGDLTLHGVTKEVTADVTHLKAAKTRAGDRCGVGATFTVNRSDYGVTTMIGDDGIGDEITLHVGVQAVAQ